MRRLAILTILLAIFFTACDQVDETVSEVEKVIAIQRQIAETLSDSSYIQLKEVERLLTTVEAAPDSLRAENNYLLGLHFRQEKQLDSAAFYFHGATEFIKDSVYKKRDYNYFQTAWSTYYNQGKYGDCITILEKYKSLLNIKRQRRPVSWAFYNEQQTYTRMKRYDKALEVNKERVVFARERDSLGLPSALISQAKLKYQYLKDKEGALSILEDLIANIEPLNYGSRGQVYSTYAILSHFEGDYKAAYTNYLRAIENIKRQDESSSKFNNLINEYNNTSKLLMTLGDYDQARLYLDTIRSFGTSSLSRRQQKSLFQYELQYASETDKDTKQVLSIVDSIYTNLDNVYDDKLNNELLALTKANENERILEAAQQASEVENVKLQSRMLLLIIGTVLLSTIGILFYRQRKFRFEKQELRMQQRLLRSQMNPHFTFNTLAAIQNKIKVDHDGASKYLLKFSRLLRVILENSMHNYVQLEKELESLRKYMDLQLFRFPDSFTYDITLDGIAEDDFIFIPPMLIQPFVENSIEHGFAGVSHLGKIHIVLSKKGDFLQCRIDDNGIGVQSISNEEKQSASTQLISEFLENATKSKLTVHNKGEHTENETGTVVSFLIPCKVSEDD